MPDFVRRGRGLLVGLFLLFHRLRWGVRPGLLHAEDQRIAAGRHGIVPGRRTDACLLLRLRLRLLLNLLWLIDCGDLGDLLLSLRHGSNPGVILGRGIGWALSLVFRLNLRLILGLHTVFGSAIGLRSDLRGRRDRRWRYDSRDWGTLCSHPDAGRRQTARAGAIARRASCSLGGRIPGIVGGCYARSGYGGSAKSVAGSLGLSRP